MTQSLKIASIQTNPVVGDIPGNLEKAQTHYAKAKAEGADIVVFSELFIIGYAPEDLVLRPSAVTDCKTACERLAAKTKNGPAIVFSTPWLEDDELYNAALFMRGGKITDIRFKHHLPNYGVFDEARVFTSGSLPQPIDFQGISIGLPVCEDLWQDTVADHLKDAGAEIMISPNGSPWRRTALSERVEALGEKVITEGLPCLLYTSPSPRD